jgi:hypothetical protein
LNETGIWLPSGGDDRVERVRRAMAGPIAAGSGTALVVIGLAWAGLLHWPLAYAQYVPNYFPAGVPGFDQELGVTVVQRVRPLYEESGLRAGSFIVHADLDQTVGYNSNVFGYAGAAGSPTIETAPSLSINSDWSRNALGASISMDDYRYLGASSQNVTSWNAALGGAITIGRSDLAVAYSHASLSESPTDIGAPPSATPIPYTIDDFRTDTTIDLGRIQITPNFDYSLYRYGTAAVIGQPSNQSFRDSNVARGGAAVRYQLSDQRSLLVVMQAIDSDFINPQPDTPSLSSTSALVMGGLDYQYDGLWRYQVLAGMEVRNFAASGFATRAAPIAKATVIWTPSGLTTVTGTVLRTLDDPVEEGSSGFTYSSAQLRVDHEYRRNILLNGEIGVRLVNYLQSSGNQTQPYVSVGATWLMNEHMHLTGQYTYTNESASGSTVNAATNTALFSGNYNQSLVTLNLHLAL